MFVTRSAYHTSLIMEQRALENVNSCLNTKFYSYLETSGGQSYIIYLSVVHFSTPVVIRHLWQLKNVVHFFNTSGN